MEANLNHQNPIERVALRGPQMLRTGMENGAQLCDSAMKLALNATTIKSKQMFPSEGATPASMLKTGGKVALILVSIPTAICLPLIALHAGHRIAKAMESRVGNNNNNNNNNPIKDNNTERRSSELSQETKSKIADSNVRVDTNKDLNAVTEKEKGNKADGNDQLEASDHLEDVPTEKEKWHHNDRRNYEGISFRYSLDGDGDGDGDGQAMSMLSHLEDVPTEKEKWHHNDRRNYEGISAAYSFDGDEDGDKSHMSMLSRSDSHRSFSSSEDTSSSENSNLSQQQIMNDAQKIIANIVGADKNLFEINKPSKKTNSNVAHVKKLFKAENLNISELGRGNFKITYLASFNVAEKIHQFAISTFNLKGDGKGIDKISGNDLDKTDIFLRKHELNISNLILSQHLENIIPGGTMLNKETGDAFFATKTCSEGTLGNVWPKTTAEQKKQLLIDMAVGQNSLHKAGIVHGDVHIGNILVDKTTDKDGKETLTAYISDFGTAREIEKPFVSLALNTELQSPFRQKMKKDITDEQNKLKKENKEEFKDQIDKLEQNYNKVSNHPGEDSFAFGLQICRMITGDKKIGLWHSQNDIESIESTVTAYIDNIFGINDSHLKTLVTNLMAYDPDKRPMDDALIKELENIDLREIEKLWPNGEVNESESSSTNESESSEESASSTEESATSGEESTSSVEASTSRSEDDYQEDGR